MTKEEDRKARFEAGNPDLVARVLEEDAKRREDLSKKDAERQEAARKTSEADLSADSAKRAAAQALADGARRVDANNRTAAREFRGLNPAEVQQRFDFATGSGRQIPQLSQLRAPQPLQVQDFKAPLEAQRKAGFLPLAAKPAQAQPKPLSGSITIEVELKGQPVANAKVKGSTADLDGKVSELARVGNKMSVKVRT